MSADGVQLAALLGQLGATPEQARVMAAQMLKRAGQLAAERGVSEAEALRGLLELVVAGRSGETRPLKTAKKGEDGVVGDNSVG